MVVVWTTEEKKEKRNPEALQYSEKGQQISFLSGYSL